MNVSLTPELEKQIAKRVESGYYQTASEVIREGLRFFFQHKVSVDERYAERFSIGSRRELEAKLQTGIDSLDRGEGIPLEEVAQRLRSKMKPAKQKR